MAAQKRCENLYPRKGFAAGNAINGQMPTPDLSRLNTDWYFDWDHQHLSPGLPRMQDPFFVPMVWCGDRPGEVVNQGWNNPYGHWTPEELTQKAHDKHFGSIMQLNTNAPHLSVIGLEANLC